MQRYEIATLTITLGSTGKAAEAAKAFCSADGARGELFGCWFSEIGDLNKLVILRGFETAEELELERARTRLAADPFGCSEYLVEMQLESYAPMPFLPKIETGDFGPIYEVRTYQLKEGGLEPTLEAWSRAVPERTKLSPLTISLYALDGSQRITHIWPFRSLEERARIRAESVEVGVWPPKGGPAWLTTNMKSTICLPTAVSPLK